MAVLEFIIFIIQKLVSVSSLNTADFGSDIVLEFDDLFILTFTIKFSGISCLPFIFKTTF